MSEFETKRKLAEKVEEKNKVRKEKLADFVYSLAKYTFVSVVLGAIVPGILNESNTIIWDVFIIGLLLVSAFAYLANRILKN